MIAQYNTLRNQLTGDYQAFYDKAYQYAQERHYPGFYANDILMSLLDLLITAQSYCNLRILSNLQLNILQLL